MIIKVSDIGATQQIIWSTNGLVIISFEISLPNTGQTLT